MGDPIARWASHVPITSLSYLSPGWIFRWMISGSADTPSSSAMTSPILRVNAVPGYSPNGLQIRGGSPPSSISSPRTTFMQNYSGEEGIPYLLGQQVILHSGTMWGIEFKQTHAQGEMGWHANIQGGRMRKERDLKSHVLSCIRLRRNINEKCKAVRLP